MSGELQLAPLSERQEAILRTVVERFIVSGTPVGSKHVAGRGGIGFSSSTVRYELAALEELGYLDHPHTSAGRVPTDRGYRRYVDTLIEEEPAAPPAGLDRALSGVEMRRELDAALRELADALAEATHLLGVVTAPAPQTATVRHIEVLLLQPRLVMVVVITSSGEVSRRLFELDAPADPGLAEWARAFLNERVTGLPVGARMMANRLDEPSLSAAERGFLELLAPALTDLQEDGRLLVVAGQAQLVSGLRDLDIAVMDHLLRKVEERYELGRLLQRALASNEIYLRIGAELPDPDLSDLSIVAANYGVARRNLGTVSLLGPTRMDYRLAIAAVREAAHLLSEYVEGVYE